MSKKHLKYTHIYTRVLIHTHTSAAYGMRTTKSQRPSPFTIRTVAIENTSEHTLGTHKEHIRNTFTIRKVAINSTFENTRGTH